MFKRPPKSYDFWLEEPYQRGGMDMDVDDFIEDEVEIKIYSHIDGALLKTITIERSYHPSKECWIEARYQGRLIKRLSQTIHEDITEGFSTTVLDTTYTIIHEK